MDFSKYKFHPSSLGLIMTDSRTKEALGETCKSHLAECYVREVYGREKDVHNKYIEKGLLVEEDSITLYSRATKTFFKKNKEVIENDYLIGCPDLFLGAEIRKATHVKDIKSSWDIFTFHAVMTKAMDKRYEWQLQGYSDLTGAQELSLVYCLVNTPEQLIWKEKDKLKWAMGIIDPSISPEFQAACEEIEKAAIFDDIDISKRYIEFKLYRNDAAIAKAHDRIEECREFLSAL